MDYVPNSLKNIYDMFLDVRKSYTETSKTIDTKLDLAINVLYNAISLGLSFTVETDDEHYVLELYHIAFRRIISIISCLQHGFNDEGGILYRNLLESMSIAIDITYNKDSLDKWKQESSSEIKAGIAHNDHFKFGKVWSRIESKKEGNLYPPKIKEFFLKRIVTEYSLASNKFTHLHTRYFINPNFNYKERLVRLADQLDKKELENNFLVLAILAKNIALLIFSTPKYNKIIEDPESNQKIKNLLNDYMKLDSITRISNFDKCIILHGCPPSEDKLTPKSQRWMNWLEEELQKMGLDAIAPDMPTPWNPKYSEWKLEIEKYSPTPESILVGHSCSAAFLVRWLMETNTKVKKLILVAPAKFPENPTDTRSDLYDFELTTPKSKIADEVAIFTSNDFPHHMKSLPLYQTALSAKTITVENKVHFLFASMGTNEFPELLKEVLL